MYNLLLVEDNEAIIKGLEYTLKEESFNVYIAMDVKTGKEIIEKENINIVILDISLPDGDGFELCKFIKSKSDTPIIFLTARDEESNVVMGLDIGADDYITKPFRVRELISRINTVLRRCESGSKSKNILKVKNIQIDVSKGSVLKDNEELEVTALEYRILLMLFSNQGQIISREQILEKIWDMAGNFVNDNTLTVYIKRIREKIEENPAEPDIIKTIRGMGYRVG